MIDDTSLTKQKDLDAFLYQVTSGRERGRLNNDGVTGKQRMWATSALITAEKSVLFSGDLNLKGKVGRVLEINISDTELFDNAEQAEKIQSLYRENFGLLEPVYLKSLLECQITERIYTLLNDEIKEIRALSQTNDELVKRLETVLHAAKKTTFSTVLSLTRDNWTGPVTLSYISSLCVYFLITAMISSRISFM